MKKDFISADYWDDLENTLAARGEAKKLPNNPKNDVMPYIVNGSVNLKWICRLCGKPKEKHFANPTTHGGSWALCKPIVSLVSQRYLKHMGKWQWFMK